MPKRLALIVYLLILLWLCTQVPFILPDEFYEHYGYIIASTFAGFLLTITSLATNGFVCYVLVFFSNVGDPTDYLFVLIAIADMFLPLLKYPIMVADLWIYKKKLYMDVNYLTFRNATERFAASHNGVAAASVFTFTLICIIRFFQAFRKDGFKRMKTSWKIASSIMLGLSALVIGLVNYHFIKEEWFHAFQAPVCLYFPLFVMASTLISGFLKTELSTSYNEGSTGRLLAIYGFFLVYFFLWTPSFTLDMLHNYCCTFGWYQKERAKVIVENLFHYKCCINVFILYSFDDQFRRIAKLASCCFRFGKKNVSFAHAHAVASKDIRMRFTVNNEEMLIFDDQGLDTEDERTLII